MYIYNMYVVPVFALVAVVLFGYLYRAVVSWWTYRQFILFTMQPDFLHRCSALHADTNDKQ